MGRAGGEEPGPRLARAGRTAARSSDCGEGERRGRARCGAKPAPAAASASEGGRAARPAAAVAAVAFGWRRLATAEKAARMASASSLLSDHRACVVEGGEGWGAARRGALCRGDSPLR